MTTHDACWDEDRGGGRRSENLVSFPRGGDFYRATEHALPWQDGHDDDRAAVPSAFLESLFAQAPVEHPMALRAVMVIERCPGPPGVHTPRSSC